MSIAEAEKQLANIELYLEKVIPAAVKSHGLTEGAVQSVVSKTTSGDWAVLDREVLPSYPDMRARKSAMDWCKAPLLDAARIAAKSDLKLPRPPASLGAECDLLAIDKAGRILAIEVKPMSAGTIAWVPAQAAMYGRVLQRWIDADPGAAREVLVGMLEQRQALGHATGFKVQLPKKPIIVPVVVLQRGASQKMLDQMDVVRAKVDAQSGLPPVETYEVSVLGDFTPMNGAG